MVKRRLTRDRNVKKSFTKPSQPSAYNSRTETLVTLVDWGRAVFALVATLAMIGLVAYGARRLGMIQPHAPGLRRLKVLESLMLDPRRRLVVVRFDDREHLLLLSPAGDRAITDVAAKEIVPSGETPT